MFQTWKTTICALHVHIAHCAVKGHCSLGAERYVQKNVYHKKIEQTLHWSLINWCCCTWTANGSKVLVSRFPKWWRIIKSRLIVWFMQTFALTGLDLHEYVSGFVRIWPPDLSGCSGHIIFLFIWQSLDRYRHTMDFPPNFSKPLWYTEYPKWTIHKEKL